MKLIISILIILIPFNIVSIYGYWPASDDSSVYIVGLFPDRENTSEPTKLSIHARAMFQAAMVLAQRLNYTVDGKPIGWRVFQTGGSLMNALSITCSSVSSLNVVGIVGPAFSREAHTLAAFGAHVDIPIISYSATDPDLRDISVYPTFHRTVPSDEAAAIAMLALFQKYNWTSCSIVHQNDAFGSGGARIISEKFSRYGLIITKTIEFDLTEKLIYGDLKELLTSSASRIVILWAEEAATSIILKEAVRNNVAGPHFTWILSTSIPGDDLNSSVLDALVGTFVVEPVVGNTVDASINDTLLNAAIRIWNDYEPNTFPTLNQIDSYGFFAFDAAWSFIQALSSSCINYTTPTNKCIELSGHTTCFHRNLANSNLLKDAIRANQFIGVSGALSFSLNNTDRKNGIFYQAKNYQKSSNGLRLVRVLEYSLNRGWISVLDNQFIIWPGGVLTPPSGRPKLHGVKLYIGAPRSMPFAFETNTTDAFGNNSTRLSGYAIDLLNALQARLGFQSTIVFTNKNQTYTQLIKEFPSSSYDILIGDITVNSMRRDIVDFSGSIYDNSLRLLGRKSTDPDIDWLSYLKPFSRSLWLLVLASAVYAALLICLIERTENESLNHGSLFKTFGMSLWYSVGVIFGYGVDFHAKTPAGRVLTIGLYMLSLVFVATYTANLASDLTISKTKQLISGIEDIKSGRLPFSRIGIRVGTAHEDYFLREISGGSRNFFPLHSRLEQTERLLNGTIDVTIADISTAEYLVNNIYCNLSLIGSDFEKSTYGIVFRKGWIYSQEIDVAILALREAGIFDDLRKQWFQTKLCVDDSTTSTEITIESLAGLFLTFGIISVLALIGSVFRKRDKIRRQLLKLNEKILAP